MLAPLEHWQTEVMGPDAADQQMVAVHQQMLWRNGRRQVGATLADKINGLTGGDMFQHHLELGKTSQHRL